MHTHHAWVLLEKFLSSDFLVIEKHGLLRHAVAIAPPCREARPHCTAPRERVALEAHEREKVEAERHEREEQW